MNAFKALYVRNKGLSCPINLVTLTKSEMFKSSNSYSDLASDRVEQKIISVSIKALVYSISVKTNKYKKSLQNIFYEY